MGLLIHQVARTARNPSYLGSLMEGQCFPPCCDVGGVFAHASMMPETQTPSTFESQAPIWRPVCTVAARLPGRDLTCRICAIRSWRSGGPVTHGSGVAVWTIAEAMRSASMAVAGATSSPV